MGHSVVTGVKGAVQHLLGYPKLANRGMLLGGDEMTNALAYVWFDGGLRGKLRRE